MSGFEVDPARLSHAARGLDDVVRSDFERAAAAMRRGYPLQAPGLGSTLGAVEGFYNDIAEYNVRNLGAAAAAVAEVAAGLRATLRNHEDSDTEHVAMLGHAPAAATDAASGAGATGALAVGARDLPAWARPAFAENPAVVAVTSQEEFLRISFATAGMAPSFLPTPVAISGLVANLDSIRTAADDLAAVAASLQTEANARFEQFTTEAAQGWTDGGVDRYRAVVSSLHDELAQARTTIDAIAATLLSVHALLESFWRAFIVFTGQFFATVTQLRTSRPAPQAATVESQLATLGSAASARWLAAQRTVLATVSGAISQLDGMVTDVTTGRATPSARPDIGRVTIAWPTG